MKVIGFMPSDLRPDPGVLLDHPAPRRRAQAGAPGRVGPQLEQLTHPIPGRPGHAQGQLTFDPKTAARPRRADDCLAHRGGFQQLVLDPAAADERQHDHRVPCDFAA
jgi:hypothetical protein